jgi:hypothetical protein
MGKSCVDEGNALADEERAGLLGDARLRLLPLHRFGDLLRGMAAVE